VFEQFPKRVTVTPCVSEANMSESALNNTAIPLNLVAIIKTPLKYFIKPYTNEQIILSKEKILGSIFRTKPCLFGEEVNKQHLFN